MATGFDPFAGITEVELVFDDSRFKGAVVVARMDIAAQEQFELYKDANGEDVAQKDAYRIFGERILKRWNLQHEGQQIPANGDGMLQIPAALANLIMIVWAREVWSSRPLETTSTDS